MIFHRFSLILLSIVFAVFVFTTATATAQNTTTPSQSDKRFVRSALEGENAEVELGELAVQKSDRTDVKQFGQKMIDDHTKLTERMRQVAEKEGIREPSKTSAKDKTLESKLRKMSGAEFDKAYLKAMVQDQREGLDAFNREANRGNDTEIKDAASQGAQVIGEHLKLAEQLTRRYGVEPGQ